MVHIIMAVNVFSPICGESTKPSSPLALKCRCVQPMVVGVLWIPPVDMTDSSFATSQCRPWEQANSTITGTYLYVYTYN